MHARGADGSLKPIEFEMPQEPEFFMGGGGLYSTGSDYLKFVRMFLNHGSPINGHHQTGPVGPVRAMDVACSASFPQDAVGIGSDFSVAT